MHLRGQDVEWKTCVRYLGVRINHSLRMVPQIDHVIQLSRAGRTTIRPILTSRVPIPLELRRTKLVCFRFGVATSKTPSPAESHGADDCGDQMVNQKQRHRQGHTNSISQGLHPDTGIANILPCT
ncbi:hypothetical protein EVAR_78612_1 [Eumeta japonica]|uniref:Uncharacterized protein n=1 Tax=Eumeta variegata TaxID=151549 RepID=A0A4C1U967_EUMVA|nr:hypothetical protein EVAR_78612_1 [Eumeta japonica]